MDEIIVQFREEELWLIHDSSPFRDGDATERALVKKVWYGILSLKSSGEEQVSLMISADEATAILDRLPSKASDIHKGLLVKCIRALWQVENGIPLLDAPPADEAIKGERLKEYLAKKEASKVKPKRKTRPLK